MEKIKNWNGWNIWSNGEGWKYITVNLIGNLFPVWFLLIIEFAYNGLTKNGVITTFAQPYTYKSLKDRDDLKRGLKISLGNDKKLLFRKWFIEENDLFIARTLLNDFLSIKEKWPNAWEKNSILVKSTGMIALLNFFGDIFKTKVFETNQEIKKSVFDEIFAKVSIKDDDFNNENYPSAGIGQSKLRKQLNESLES